MLYLRQRWWCAFFAAVRRVWQDSTAAAAWETQVGWAHADAHWHSVTHTHMRTHAHTRIRTQRHTYGHIVLHTHTHTHGHMDTYGDRGTSLVAQAYA
jgi:hypothetical protein